MHVHKTSIFYARFWPTCRFAERMVSGFTQNWQLLALSFWNIKYLVFLCKRSTTLDLSHRFPNVLQAMLANLSSTPPFASLLRKQDDSKPGSLPSESNLKNSPTLLYRRVRITTARDWGWDKIFLLVLCFSFLSLCSSGNMPFFVVSFWLHNHSFTICTIYIKR